MAELTPCTVDSTFASRSEERLNTDQGGDLLLRQAQPNAGVTDDYMFLGDMFVHVVSLPLSG